jgi:hypothetical protein
MVSLLLVVEEVTLTLADFAPDLHDGASSVFSLEE